MSSLVLLDSSSERETTAETVSRAVLTFSSSALERGEMSAASAVEERAVLTFFFGEAMSSRDEVELL
jgi:hypothetical protein